MRELSKFGEKSQNFSIVSKEKKPISIDYPCIWGSLDSVVARQIESDLAKKIMQFSPEIVTTYLHHVRSSNWCFEILPVINCIRTDRAYLNLLTDLVEQGGGRSHFLLGGFFTTHEWKKYYSISSNYIKLDHFLNFQGENQQIFELPPNPGVPRLFHHSSLITAPPQAQPGGLSVPMEKTLRRSSHTWETTIFSEKKKLFVFVGLLQLFELLVERTQPPNFWKNMQACQIGNLFP